MPVSAMTSAHSRLSCPQLGLPISLLKSCAQALVYMQGPERSTARCIIRTATVGFNKHHYRQAILIPLTLVLYKGTSIAPIRPFTGPDPISFCFIGMTSVRHEPKAQLELSYQQDKIEHCKTEKACTSPVLCQPGNQLASV